MPETKGYIKTSDEKGSVSICHSVVATIAAAAASDVDGVYGLYQYPGRELTAVSGKKGISKGVKITVEDEVITADVFIIAQMDCSVSEVGREVQKSVMAAVEEAIGVKINTVNVSISGISLKKAAKNA
ncbi:MAG: Asp23/Gls24 family envelope stress response protein [Oscillospiraceae bacterium]|nr:Asp23/Gls24 family envelope stress response protein [Oscillospiraceae bacterium]